MRTVIALVLLPSLAFAQSPEVAERRSTKVAVLASIAVTAAGIGLLMVGADAAIRPQAYGSLSDGVEIGATTAGALATLVGPSIGSLYAERFWNLGLLFRCIAVQIFGTGLLTAYAGATSTRLNGGPNPIVLLSLGIGSILGAATYLAGAVVELALMPKAVDQYNQGHGFALAPTAIRVRGGLAPGLALSARF